MVGLFNLYFEGEMRYNCSNKSNRGMGASNTQPRFNHQQRNLQMAIPNRISFPLKNQPTSHHCTCCNLDLPITEFKRTSTGKLRNQCKSCRTEIGRKSAERNNFYGQKPLNRNGSNPQLPKPRKSESKTGVIYFIYSPELDKIKIGFTSNSIVKRFVAIQGNSPARLELMATMNGTAHDEYLLHQNFEHCHSHCEWFNAAPDLLTYIKVKAIPSDLLNKAYPMQLMQEAA